jgi:predicted aminopeptidase
MSKSELKEKLQFATDVLAFAEESLDLPSDDSYQTYVETGREAVVWNVIATPELSLEAKKWCFPVAGCVPYKGYFKKQKAQEQAAKLRKKGFDVIVSPATAYSTLGWFDDPLLDTMLNRSQTQLAATLIHELAHARLYVSGDTMFNESYAGFVEARGVESWLNFSNQTGSIERWQSSRAAVKEFHQFLSVYRSQLSQLYRSGLAESRMRERKQEIFESMHRAYLELKEHKWDGIDYFGSWFEPLPNNASLALFQSYQGGICSFSSLFGQAGEDFEAFHILAGEQAELSPEKRREWLLESC